MIKILSHCLVGSFCSVFFSLSFYEHLHSDCRVVVWEFCKHLTEQFLTNKQIFKTRGQTLCPGCSYTIFVSYTQSMGFYCHCKHYITLTSLHNIHTKNFEMWIALPNDARCMVASIYLAQDNHLSFFCIFLYLSISIPSAISVFPSLSLISISLVISIFLAISISLYIGVIENYSTWGNIANDFLRLAYLRGHCFVHFALLYLAEMEIHRIKIDDKTKRQKNINRHIQIPIANVCYLPGPPSYHERLLG
jgi:hypothetical protein